MFRKLFSSLSKHTAKAIETLSIEKCLGPLVLIHLAKDMPKLKALSISIEPPEFSAAMKECAGHLKALDVQFDCRRYLFNEPNGEKDLLARTLELDWGVFSELESLWVTVKGTMLLKEEHPLQERTRFPKLRNLTIQTLNSSAMRLFNCWK